MNPRLKSSKKWTQFPQEYSDQIRSVFMENFAQDLEETEGELIVEGRIYPEEILLRVGYHQKGRLAQANFEVSINYNQDSDEAIQRIHNCVDVAASMMMEYFDQDGDVDFPYTWREYPFQGQKVYLKFSSENTTLEAEANRLLGLESESLLNEESESEDALARAEDSEELSPPQDEDEDDGDYEYLEDDDSESDEDLNDEENRGPRMFRGKPKKNLH